MTTFLPWDSAVLFAKYRSILTWGLVLLPVSHSLEFLLRKLPCVVKAIGSIQNMAWKQPSHCCLLKVSAGQMTRWYQMFRSHESPHSLVHPSNLALWIKFAECSFVASRYPLSLPGGQRVIQWYINRSNRFNPKSGNPENQTWQSSCDVVARPAST